MIRAVLRARGLGLAGVSLAAGHLRAERPAPRIDEVRPLGVRRGFANALTVRGSAPAGHPKLVAPFSMSVAPSKQGGVNADALTTRITVDAGTPLVHVPVRVQPPALCESFRGSGS